MLAVVQSGDTFIHRTETSIAGFRQCAVRIRALHQALLMFSGVDDVLRTGYADCVLNCFYRHGTGMC